jgi:hypothetical protein
MAFTTVSSGEGRTGMREHAAPSLCHMRQMDAPAAYRVEFYLIYVAISVAGLKMSWTARSWAPDGCASAGVASRVTDATNGGGRTGIHTTPTADDDRNSGTNLCLVREFSTVVRSSAATWPIQWAQVDLNATGA